MGGRRLYPAIRWGRASAKRRHRIGSKFLAIVREEFPVYAEEEGGHPFGHVMATKRHFVIENIAEESMMRLEQRKQVVENHGFHSAVLVPLLGNDRAIGVLAIMDIRIR